jgi:hypothetical protein
MAKSSFANSNMTIIHDTDGNLKFWLQIQNRLEIWALMIYRSSHVGSLIVNHILGLEHWYSCCKGYRSDMWISSSDLESTHKIGPDDVQIRSFGQGHLIISQYLDWSIYSKGYRSVMKILSAYSESPHKTCLDTSWTIPHGANHISWFWHLLQI